MPSIDVGVYSINIELARQKEKELNIEATARHNKEKDVPSSYIQSMRHVL